MLYRARYTTAIQISKEQAARIIDWTRQVDPTVVKWHFDRRIDLFDQNIHTRLTSDLEHQIQSKLHADEMIGEESLVSIRGQALKWASGLEVLGGIVHFNAELSGNELVERGFDNATACLEGFTYKSILGEERYPMELLTLSKNKESNLGYCLTLKEPPIEGSGIVMKDHTEEEKKQARLCFAKAYEALLRMPVLIGEEDDFLDRFRKNHLGYNTREWLGSFGLAEQIEKTFQIEGHVALLILSQLPCIKGKTVDLYRLAKGRGSGEGLPVPIDHPKVLYGFLDLMNRK